MSYSVAIDGPAGAGKSTIAKLVAKKRGYIYVDTGAMYRAMALYLLRTGVDTSDRAAIAKACQNADISIAYQKGEQVVLLNGENVNAYLRTEEVGNMASVSSAVPEVRKKLVELQQELAAKEDALPISYPGNRGLQCQAEDAVLVDSSEMTIEQVVERILSLCR